MDETLMLYSLRWSVARGWYAKIERQVTIETRDDWLKVFRDDEPTVKFCTHHRTPKIWPDD